MTIVVLTNGSTHGQRILEELKRRGIAIAAVIVERPPDVPRPPLRECLRQLGYQTTAATLYRELCEKVWPNLPAIRYRRYARNARRVTDFNSQECDRLLAGLRPDLILLGGARILKRHILERASVAVLNAHPGLLPKYRGNDVIAWALYNGDPIGVTVHAVDAGIDTGAILMRQPLAVGQGDSIAQLKAKAEQLAASMMGQAVDEILDGGRLEPMAVTEPRGPLYRQMPPDLRATMERRLRER